jgi:hypothetical protein
MRQEGIAVGNQADKPTLIKKMIYHHNTHEDLDI